MKNLTRSLSLAALLAAAPSLFAQFADLVLAKAGPDEAAAGTDVTYVVTVENLGPNPAADVTLTDNIPAGMTFVEARQTAGPAFICTTPAEGDPGAVTCTIQAFAANAVADFEFVFHIPAGTAPGTTFTNIVTVSQAPPEADPNEENNQGVSVTTVEPPPQADLAISKEGPTAAGPGTDVTYTITIANGGPSAATDLTFTDTLPGTMTFVELEQHGTTLSCTTPAIGAGGTITCTAASYPAVATTVLTLTGRIPAEAVSGETFTNTGFITAASADPNEENNSGSISTTVSQVDLSVVKTGPATAVAGTEVDYTLTLTNEGPDFASDVILTDILPPGTTFVSFVRNSGPAPSCNLPAAGTNDTVFCTYATFPVTTATFTLRINVGANETVENTAVVTTESFDDDETNDSSTATTTITPVADVAIFKGGPTTSTAGQSLTYTIIATNEGPSTATNVTLQDVLPAGATLVSFTQTGGPAFVCSGTTTITCTHASLVANAPATFSLVVDVDPAYSDGTTLTNTATIDTTTGDSDASNDTASVNTTISALADLGIAKSGPATINAGEILTYTITATNAGPSSAAQVRLEDTLPAGTTFLTMTQTSGPAFNCSAAVCEIASFAPNATATFTLQVTVPPTTASGTSLENVVTIDAVTADPDATDDRATATTNVTNSADVSITKTAPATVRAGEQLRYAINITNAGPSPASGIVFEDVIPAGTTYGGVDQTAGPPIGCSGTTTITCTIQGLDPGTTATFDFVVNVSPTLASGTVLQNTGTIETVTTDPDPTDDQSTATTTVAVSADVAVVKNGAGLVTAGTDMTYTVNVVNYGPSAAANVILSDPLPAGTTFVSIEQTSGPAFTCDQTVTCTIASLAPGVDGASTFAITVAVSPSLTNGSTITNTATVDTTTPDSDATNDQSSVQTLVATSADLSVAKTAPLNIPAGENITYTIDVANAGLSDALNVTLTDVLPAQATFVSFTQTSGPTFNCTGTATVTCTIASFATGATASFSIVMSVPPGLVSGNSLENAVTITSTTPDPIGFNNQDTTSTNVTNSADLGVTKSAPGAVAAGENLTFLITATNAGPSTAANVTLADTLPAGTTLVSLTQTSGPAFNCVGTSCTIAAFAPGTPATFTLVAAVPASTPPGTTLQNRVTIDSTFTPDPDPSNDESTTTTTVGATADVAVTKTGPATATAGTNVTYTVTVTNNGPSDASSVTLTDAVPANTTFVSMSVPSGPLFACTTPAIGATGTITCTRASFASGATTTFQFTFAVSPSTPNGTVVTNTAQIASTSDPNVTNDTATATTAVNATADVAVAKIGPGMATAGTNVTYTITVTNNGPSDASNGTLTDVVPVNTTFVSLAQPSGPLFTCTTPAVGATGTIACTRASFASGATSTFQVTFAISPAAPNGTVISNTAQIASTSDPNAANDTATATTTVGAGADVSIAKSGPATVTSGSNITYTVTVANAGPSDAASVVVTDVMPAGTTFVSASQTGPLFSCTTPAVGANGTITCTAATLPAGTSTTFTFVFHVEPATAGPLQNTATVSTPTDASPTNDNSTTIAAIATGPTDVRLTKDASASTVGPAGTATYTIVVTNLGPDTALDAVVTDTLPDGTTLRSSSSTQGGCTGTTTVTCTLGNLAPGAEATITLVVDFPARPGSFTNTASVDIANADANPANDADTAVVNVGTAANIPTLSPFALMALALTLGTIVMLRMR